MQFTAVLVVSTVVAGLVAVVARRRSTWHDHARRGMALAMVVAGVTHLVAPDPFVQHLPGWVPARDGLVLVSGLAEIGLGLALVAVGTRTRQALVGRLLALYFLAVWPANIYVAVAGVDVEGQPGGPYPWIRLPFQVLFIAWALWSTHGEIRRPTREVHTAAAGSTPVGAR